MALLTESDVRAFARVDALSAHRVLLSEAKSVDDRSRFDVFLSHSYQDKELIFGMKRMLEKMGMAVYVDWIDDPELSRDSVTSATAGRLRKRMRQSESLFYVHTPKARDSKWMPWELGYFDGKSGGRCAILPVFQGVSPAVFQGQEYLGLYPYVDVTNGSIYIHRSASEYERYLEWRVKKNY